MFANMIMEIKIRLFGIQFTKIVVRFSHCLSQTCIVQTPHPQSQCVVSLWFTFTACANVIICVVWLPV